MPEFVVSLNSPNLTMGRAGGSSASALGEALVGSWATMELCLRFRFLAIVTGAMGVRRKSVGTVRVLWGEGVAGVVGMWEGR